MKKNKYNKLIFPLIIGVVLVSCQAIYEDGNEMANQYKKHIEVISVDQLNAKIDNAAEFLLIDCREPAEYRAGNIPGSFNVPRGELEFKILNDAFWEEEYMYTPYKTDTIVIYCKKGARGTLAAYSLKQLGFQNVLNLEGGWLGYNGGEMPAEVSGSSGGCGD